MGALNVGDELFDENGKITRVTAVYDQPENRPSNEVIFDDGSVIVADDDHLWVTETRASRQSQTRAAKPRTRHISWVKKAAVEQYRVNCDLEAPVTIKMLARKIVGGPSETIYYAAAEDLRLAGYKPGVEWAGKRSTAYYRTGTLLDAVMARMERPANDQQAKREMASVKTTAEIRRTLRVGGDARLNHSIALTKPLQTPEQELPVDPYLLGLWLTDGTTCRPEITTADDEIRQAFEDAGYPLKVRVATADRSAPTYGIGGTFSQELRSAGLINNKHIPDVYLRASEDQRRALVAGLIDGDGTVAADGQTQFCVTLKHLATAFRELVISLGLKATIRERRAVLKRADGTRKDCGPAWVVAFTATEKMARLHRKAVRTKADGSPVTRRRYITEVRPVPSVEMRCISVDAHSRLFLAGEQMIVTHNSFLAFTLAYQMAMQGVWTIYIDPKADAKPMAELAGLGKAKVFDLREGNDGMLDPFTLAEDANQAVLLALETLRLMLGKDSITGVREVVLLKALRVVAAAPNPSLGRVVDLMQQDPDPEAQGLALLLDTMRQLPFARLCFSVRGGDTIRPQDGLTVITLLGLDLPGEEDAQSDYSYDNRLAVSVMYLLTKYARQLMLSSDKSHPKAICIDEAWAITSTPQGAKLIPDIARMGRSHNTALVLVTQNAGDLRQQAVTNSISTVFAFRASKNDEIEDVLELLNADVHDGHIGAVRDLYNGECLMRDVDNRIARVQVDPWNTELFNAFNTNPETRDKQQPGKDG